MQHNTTQPHVVDVVVCQNSQIIHRLHRARVAPWSLPQIRGQLRIAAAAAAQQGLSHLLDRAVAGQLQSGRSIGPRHLGVVGPWGRRSLNICHKMEIVKVLKIYRV